MEEENNNINNNNNYNINNNNYVENNVSTQKSIFKKKSFWIYSILGLIILIVIIYFLFINFYPKPNYTFQEHNTTSFNLINGVIEYKEYYINEEVDNLTFTLSIAFPTNVSYNEFYDSLRMEYSSDLTKDNFFMDVTKRSLNYIGNDSRIYTIDIYNNITTETLDYNKRKAESFISFVLQKHPRNIEKTQEFISR